GDIDGNGEVNVTDAILALRASMGVIELDEVQQLAADVSGNGSVGVEDALLILRFAMGLIEEF
ncbi:MAG: dockerin type I repeat-containing protein, partial [Clostridia bacterium]|nr:dockerin type I repeat-containing protein [Clostridia bacterium]